MNLIVIDKQPQLQWLDMDDGARALLEGRVDLALGRLRDGDHEDPDVVLASAGDIPTMETLAAADMLLEHVPDLSFRVVNVVDLMTLFLGRRPSARHGRRHVPRPVHRRPRRRLRVPRVPDARCTT